MNLWLVNLKDNRDNAEENNNLKFRICKALGIIAIGWSNNRTCADEENGRIAKRLLGEMKEGDYAWVIHPTEGIYYLAKIIDASITESYKLFHDEDINLARRVDYLTSIRSKLFCKGAKRLFAYRAVQMNHDAIIEEYTEQLLKDIGEE